MTCQVGSWQSNFGQWVPVWAAVRGLRSFSDGDAVQLAPAGGAVPPQYVVTWPGRDTGRAAAEVAGRRGARLTLVTDDAETAHRFAVAQGLVPLSRMVLLTADPSDLPQVPQLPEGAELRLTEYADGMVVEISVSGGRMARGRIAPGDGFAVFGGIDLQRPDPDHTMESAVLAALTGEASGRDVPLILLPALPKSALWYGRQGWSPTADILTFTRAGER